MFSTLPSHTNVRSNQHYYTPHKPSPLSSSPLRNTTPSPLSQRDTNVPSSRANQHNQDSIMSSPSKVSSPSSTFQFSIFTTPPEPTTTTSASQPLISPPPSHPTRTSSYSKRNTKPNPLMSGRGSGDEGRETRRKLFLKRVREGSEEKKWASRGGDEEIMRCLWVAEERRRGERRRMEALCLGLGLGLGEEADFEDVGELSIDEVMAEEVAMNEKQELEAMLGSMSPEESAYNYGSANSNGVLFEEMDTGTRTDYKSAEQQSIYGSDDDEYNQLFMDVIEQEGRMLSQLQQQQQQPPSYVQDDDAMDMS